MAQLESTQSPVPLPQAPEQDEVKAAILERDDVYCLTSDFRSFRVENCLFRIPVYRLLDESNVFGGMFELLQPPQESSQALDLETPIEMPSTVAKEDFRNFLKALYPRKASIKLALDQAEWISVLRLSTLWSFLSFRAIAIAELKKTLTPSDKIFYGREFRVSSWFSDGLKSLITRPETISKAEAMRIDYETTFSMFRLRERTDRSCYSLGVQEGAFMVDFGEEMDKIKSDQAGLEGKIKKGGPA